MKELLNIYTVSFFGHRMICDILKLEQLLEKHIKELLNEKNYIEFLIGRDGEFDLIVAACIKRIKKNFADYNNSLIWIMPYVKSEYLKNKKNLEEYYDEIEICSTSQYAHPKGAIQIRNKTMIDRSDLVFFYVEHKHGGAYQSMRYAEKQGKKIINLHDELIR